METGSQVWANAEFLEKSLRGGAFMWPSADSVFFCLPKDGLLIFEGPGTQGGFVNQKMATFLVRSRIMQAVDLCGSRKRGFSPDFFTLLC